MWAKQPGWFEPLCYARGMDIREFGSLLHTYRRAAGLSLRRLAERADVNHGSLSHTESGNRERRLPQDAVERIDAALAAEGAIMQAWHRLPAPAGRWPAPPPNQLPPDPVLIGRQQLLDDIHDAIAHEPPGHARPTVVLLTGPGGVGKTAAAVRGGHHLIPSREGALVADMRGWNDTHGPRLISDVLHSWTRALGASTSEAGGELDDLAALWRSMTAGRALVLLIDNVPGDLDLNPLLPASPESVILVTSRDRMITADGFVHAVPVTPLPDPDAAQVLELHSGMPVHVVAPLVERCGGLPIALRVAGKDAGAHWQPEEISEMADNFDELFGEPLDQVAKGPYERLSAETARAWRLLAHVGDPSLGAAAAALGASSTQTRQWLHEAAEANLLERDGATWRYHDLLRGFAVRTSHRIDEPAVIHDVVRRSMLWFLHGLAAADRFFAARDDQPDLLPLPDDIEAPQFGSYDEAWAWVEGRWYAVVPAVELAVRSNEPTLAWQLVAILFHYAFLAKPWESWTKATRAALTAARQAQDQTGQAWMHHCLSYIAGDEAYYDSAAEHEHTALELRRWLGGQRDIGWSAINLVRWRFALNEPDEAIDPLITEALECHRAIGMRAGIALALASRGGLAARRGDLTDAREHLDAAVGELPGLGDPAIYCYVETALAEVLIQQGNLTAGREHAQLADTHAVSAGADYFRVAALSAIADTYSSTNPDQREQLRDALALALALAEQLGDPREADLRERLDQINT